MNLKKNFRTMLIGLMLVVGFIAVAPLTFVYASTYNITAETQYINKSIKRVCGYVKDSDGNPLASKTLYVARYDTYISSGEQNKLIKNTEMYDIVKTDSNGYYSVDAYMSGYYYMFLPSRSLTYSEVEDFYLNGGKWPSRFVIDGDKYYACDDSASAFVLISNH